MFDSQIFERIFPDFLTGNPKPGRLSFDYLTGCFLPFGVKHRHSFFQDPRLLRRDLFQGIPQNLLVIHPDRRNGRDCRMLYGVGGIQPPAQSGLQHRKFHSRFRKRGHCHAKQQFKKSGMRKTLAFHFPDLLHHLFKYSHKFPVRNLLSMDPDPLIHPDQMGGDEEARGFPLRPQHGIQIHADRAFSVGPRHMDDLQVPLRISQKAQKILCMLQRVFLCKFRDL